MKILVVGSGGREHAIAWRLSKDEGGREIYCAPGNAGIAQLAECEDIADTDVEQLLAFAETHKIDLCISAFRWTQLKLQIYVAIPDSAFDTPRIAFE